MSGEGFGMSFGVGTGEGETPPEAPRASFEGGLPAGGALPLRVVVCADFRGAPAARDAAPRRVRLSTFDDDFAASQVSLFLHAPDLLGASEKTLELSLSPKRLADLRPDAILAGCEALAPLARLRDELSALSAGTLPAERFEAGLGAYRAHAGLSPVLDELDRALSAGAGSAPSAPAPAAPPASKPASKPPAGGGSLLDNLLDMVAIPGQESAPTPSEARAKGAVEAFVSGSGKRALDLSRADAALASLTEAQLAPVLAHPQLRRVEAAWRGLHLVLEAAGREKTIWIELLDTDLAAAEETFQQRVVAPALVAGDTPPPSLVLLDRAFGRSAVDLAALGALATGAESIQAPLIVSLSDEFLGVERASDLAGRDQLADLFERGLEKWHALRKQEPSRWLAAAYNALLLRLPAERGQKGSKCAGEQVKGPADLLWGNAGWGLLATVVGSAARCGWASEFRGAKAGLGDRPLRATAPADQQGPLAVRLSDQHVADFAGEGIVALTSPQRSDQIVVLRGPVVRKAPSGEPRNFTMLAYQLVASRIAETLLRAKGRIRGGDPTETAGRWQDFALAVIGDTGPGAGVGAAIREGVLELRVKTGAKVMGGVELRLGFRV